MRKLSSMLVGLILAFPSVAFCQIQRIVIPEANISLAPGSKATVRTYCTDYGIAAPKSGQTYEHLLTDNGSVRVIVGGKEMSFSDAISQKKIALVTPTATISSVIERQQIFQALDPTTKVPDNAALLKLLPPEERRRLLADYPNPRRLQIVNISGEPLEFHATNAALGVADAPPPLLPTGTSSQTSLWIAPNPKWPGSTRVQSSDKRSHVAKQSHVAKHDNRVKRFPA